ncbi:MAG: hypothetical protein EOP92_33970 [Lysobacteraceae bacterium]|jgi:hypothetical protein|nr:MAG: hypothetical protein EOP92_33970 [Xanthomonadaceae bacterium]
MKNKQFLARCLLAISAAGVVFGASAQAARPDVPPPSEPRRDLAPPRNPVSLSDSVRRAQRETGGQILGAERVQYDGREINRIKVMDDRGRVRYMDDDPQRSRDGSDGPRNLLPRDEAQPRPRGERPRRP